MVKLIRSNQKKFLAAFSALLMVTFLVNRGGPGGNDGSDQKFATLAGKTIYASEMKSAREELSALKNNLNFSEDDRDSNSRSLQQLIMVMTQKPELFFLLRHESRDLNVQVSRDDVLGTLANHARDLQPDTDQYDVTYEGVTDLLKVLARFEQVSSAIKISRPMVNRALVQEHETIQANLVQLNAQDYLSKVPAPTTQQVQNQFQTFADSAPHHPVPTTNPFGFGYKLPLRAKLQYLRLSTDAVATAVIATKSAYEWEVAANKYYLLNATEFIPKPDPKSPTTAPAAAPPFAVVHDQVLQKIRQPLVTALMDQIQGFISAALNTDYQTYSKLVASSTTAPPEPVSSLGVPYSSFTYLSKLIDKVREKYNVTIMAGESPDFLAQEQIGNIPGVGSAPLASYIVNEATNYLAQLQAKLPAATGLLLRPSLPFPASEAANSLAIVRMTDALPSQAPASLSQVEGSVTADVRIGEAYKLAQTDAAFLRSAKAGTFLAVAQAGGHPSISLNAESALSLDSNDVKGIFPPLADSAPSFMTQAFRLLNTYNPKENPHPVETIELPEQARLFVAQLTVVNAAWNSQSYFRDAFGASLMAGSMQQRMLASSWFDYATVTKRLDFKSTKSDNN